MQRPENLVFAFVCFFPRTIGSTQRVVLFCRIFYHISSFFGCTNPRKEGSTVACILSCGICVQQWI
jgi:hypothetical protein